MFRRRTDEDHLTADYSNSEADEGSFRMSSRKRKILMPQNSGKKKRMTAEDRAPKKKKKKLMQSGDLRKNRLALLKKNARKNKKKNALDEGNFEIRVSNQRHGRTRQFEQQVAHEPVVEVRRVHSYMGLDHPFRCVFEFLKVKSASLIIDRFSFIFFLF